MEQGQYHYHPHHHQQHHHGHDITSATEGQGSQQELSCKNTMPFEQTNNSREIFFQYKVK